MIKALIITHAGSGIGGGHLARCRALADGLRFFDVQVSWLLNSGAHSAVNEEIIEEGVTFTDDPFSETVFNIDFFDCIIVDSYTISMSFLSVISQKAYLVVIDDNNEYDFSPVADMIINYNLHAHDLRYDCAHCHCLLGPSFALLRKDYWNLRLSSGGGTLFLAGGADIKNATEAVVKYWKPQWGYLTVVLGSLTEENQRCRVCESVLKKSEYVQSLVAPPDFEEMMACADRVICTSSVTAYEALALEKKLIVFQVADNQIELGRVMGEQGVAVNLGYWGSWGSEELEAALSSDVLIKNFPVDRYGARRAAQMILSAHSKRGV